MPVTRRYSLGNIAAVREWAIRWLAEHDDTTDDWATVADVEDWCRAWLENDVREGGDPTVRRTIRPDWPSIVTDYQRIRQLGETINGEDT